VRVNGSPLVRPSQLARFWELHPRTVHTWIRQGRLAAIRSPGNHFRVRVADVHAFCEREGLPVPPFVAPPPRRVIVAAAPAPLRRAVARALKAAATVEAFDDPYQAVVAAASAPTAVLAMDATAPRFDIAAAVRAFKGASAAPGIAVVAFGVANRALAAALERAGVDRSVARAQPSDLPRVLRELLGLGPE
jgi:excisionase family DNA binding protein